MTNLSRSSGVRLLVSWRAARTRMNECVNTEYHANNKPKIITLNQNSQSNECGETNEEVVRDLTSCALSEVRLADVEQIVQTYFGG